MVLQAPGITVSENIYKDRDKSGAYGRQLLMHEFGHILQNRYYGNIQSVYISTSSLFSATTSKSNYEHQRNWTEIQANTLAYLYFGMPSNWNQNDFPFNLKYVSPTIIKELSSGK